MKRYSISSGHNGQIVLDISEDSEGAWVEYDDVVAEIERLQAENSFMRSQINECHGPCTAAMPCPKCKRVPTEWDVTNHCDLFGCGADCTGLWVVVCGFQIGAGCGFFGEWAETQEKAVEEWNKIERPRS